MRVLVTGGTGVLGAKVVAGLVAGGHEVVALSRRGQRAGSPKGGGGPGSVHHVRGNVLEAADVAAAAEGTQAIVHTATGGRKMETVEVEGTRHAVAAADKAGAHLVYISIVGVDRQTFSYYKAKRQAEEVVEASAGGWTILRATQFHDLLDRFLGLGAFPVTRRMAFQPVDSGEVAARLVSLVAAGPSGRVEDFGGPEVLRIREIEAARRARTGRKAVLVRLPAVAFLAGFDRGAQLCPDHHQGTITWGQWLERRYPAPTGGGGATTGGGAHPTGGS